MKGKSLFIAGVALAVSLAAGYVNADTVIFNSALTWRADGRGDYTFKGKGALTEATFNKAGEIVSPLNGTYQANASIATESNIASITANWACTGNVAVEVSADDGISYTRAVNGVPVAGGFNPGNRLTWRAILGQESGLTEVRISYTCTAANIHSFGVPELSGFKYRKEIQLKNDSALDLFNYPVKVRVGRGNYESKSALPADALSPEVYCEGNARPDFKDIRFTAADGQTPLGYYIAEEYINGGNNCATVWVKIPEIPADGVSIYLYYGNPQAESLSSASATFDLFDDFAELDKAQWSIRKTGGGSGTVSDGWLRLDHAAIIHNRIKAGGRLIEYKVKDSAGKDAIDSTREGQEKGFVGVSADGKLECDWIRVRQTAAIEPVVVPSVKEAKGVNVDLPVFVNTVINEAGDVAIKKGRFSGEYRYAPVALGGIPRVVTCAMEVANRVAGSLAIDMSYDAGKDFVQDIAGGKFYYASKNDFVPGDTLVWKTALAAKQGSDKFSGLSRLAIDYRPGKMTVIFPNGGETLGAGEQAELRWTAADYESSYPVKLEYSFDGGKTFAALAGNAANTGAYVWAVPRVETDKAVIRISDANESSVFDLSDAPFQIQKTKLPGDYIGRGKGAWHDPANWQKKAVPDLETDVRVEVNGVVYANKEIAFKSLVIGDGEGKNTTVLILKNTITPESGAIVIRKGGTLVQESKIALGIAGDLTVEAGGKLTHSTNSGEASALLDITVGNITVKKSGSISVDGKGYAGGGARSSGKGLSVGLYDKKGAGTGGSHGGSGGHSGALNGQTATYGEMNKPEELGSGGAGGKNTSGGAGGGSVKLTARKEFYIAGTISCNGADGKEAAGDEKTDGGGGAGGSICLSANHFSGMGAEITARGGSGHTSGGGGGGGRIFIKGQGAIKGTLNVNGGDGFEKGKAGSVVFE